MLLSPAPHGSVEQMASVSDVNTFFQINLLRTRLIRFLQHSFKTLPYSSVIEKKQWTKFVVYEFVVFFILQIRMSFIRQADSQEDGHLIYDKRFPLYFN